jgi:hypothetical protein
MAAAVDDAPPFSLWRAALAAGVLGAAYILPAALAGGGGASSGARLRRTPGCANCAARARLLGAGAAPYTSVSCTAGTQAFDRPFHTHDFYPQPSWVGARACLVRDACVIGGVPHFYVDAAAEARLPAPLRLEALVRAGFVFRSAHAATVNAPLAPVLVAGPRPAALRFAPRDALYLMTALNNAQNFAHVLLDTVLPAYAAADHYGLAVDDVQHVFLDSCDTFPGAARIGKSGASNAAACWENLARWYAPLMPRDAIDAAPRDDGAAAAAAAAAGGGGGAGAGGGGASAETNGATADGVCFGALLMGQDVAFSSALGGGQWSRARPVRALRARALRFAAAELGGGALQGADAARVLVLAQHAPENAATAFGDACELVRAAAAALPAPPAVECVVPALLSVAAQVAAVARAGVLVCEHGSTSYAALFAAPGAALLALVPAAAPAVKEAHVLLYLPDVDVRFVGEDDARAPGALAAALDQALRGAAQRLARPPGLAAL